MLNTLTTKPHEKVKDKKQHLCYQNSFKGKETREVNKEHKEVVEK